jgi:chloramphenicol 3-O phosphotransferase
MDLVGQVELTPGRIVVLNGAPRSGKSSIARAIQETVPGAWINLGVDLLALALPPHLRPGIGLRPGGERPDLEPAVARLYAALYESVAAHARLGLDVVVDVGHHDGYAVPRRILPECARRLAGLPALLVGVRCPIQAIMARRRHDASGTYVAAPEGAPVPEPVLRWQAAVHDPGIYDLELDTSVMTPAAAAAAIATRLAEVRPGPTAFERLARQPTGAPLEDPGGRP